jgi:hypothetical protein
MQVTISKAADMIGITRATLYRHIEKKGISVVKDDDDNPKIDVSELIRVYGSKVKIDNNTSSDDTGDTDANTVIKQSKTSTKTQGNTVELEVLKERVKHLELSNTKAEQERRREREQFEERVDQLQDTLKKAQDNQNKTTLLLEHFTKDGAGEKSWKISLKALEERIANQEKVAEEETLEKAALQKQIEEQAKTLKEKEEALALEKSKSFIHKLFGV